MAIVFPSSALYPAPTPGTTNGNSGQFINQGVQNVPENFYTVRVDHKLSSNDSLSGTFLFDDTDFTQPDAFNNDILNSHTRRQTVVLQESHTFGPSFVNAARAGFSRTQCRSGGQKDWQRARCVAPIRLHTSSPVKKAFAK